MRFFDYLATRYTQSQSEKCRSVILHTRWLFKNPSHFAF